MFTQPTQIPRSPLASVLTVVFHTGLVLLVLLVSAVPNIPRIIPHETLYFVDTAPPPPDVKIEPPKPPPPEEPARVDPPEPPKLVESPIVETPPTPPPPAPAPPPPPPVEEKAFEPPRQALPVPKSPPVTLGAFGDAPGTRIERAPTVAPTGFQAEEIQRTRQQRTVGTVDGFGAAAAGTKTTRATAVSDPGFGAAARADERRVARAGGAAGFASDEAPKPAAQQPRTTSASGFADQASSKTTSTAAPAPVTQATGFADVQAAARAAAPAPRAPKPDQPVEVTFKPTLAYTEEARARRIEGEVTLEVEFTTEGQVRVLRVVRGLGYGLDEMARRAAEQIRFKPATSRGTPVATRTTLTIVFRLT